MSNTSLEAVPGPSRAMRVHQLASTAGKNGTSSNGSSDTPLRPRKRLRRPETWKKVAAKAKRARGEEYVSPSTGKVVAARRTGPSCRCKRKRCFDLFTEEEREGLIRDFNALGDKQLQDAHLFGLIKGVEVKKRRPRACRISSSKTPRRATYTYHVSILA